MLRVAGLVLCVGGLAGCSTPTAQSVAIPAGRYREAFDAARTVLREYRFDLDRVDARAGLITTAAKPTAGLATPWDLEQSSISQEWEDLINQQQRRVTVSFTSTRPADRAVRRPPGRPGVQPSSAATTSVPSPKPESSTRATGPTPPDLLDATGQVWLRVSAAVERVQRPGWRPATRSIGMTSYTADPALAADGMLPTYVSEAGEDRRLAARIADAVRERLGLPRAMP